MKAKTFVTLLTVLVLRTYCYAQDGNFDKLTFHQITKGGGAAEYSGWGLNTNTALDIRPYSTSGPAMVINHHTGLTFSAHSGYGGLRFYNQGYPVGPLEPSTGATMVMSINNNAVGIGTTNPRAPFDMASDITNGKLGAVLGRLPEGDSEGEGTYLGVRGYNTNFSNGGKSFSLEHSFYGVTNSSINFFRGGDRTGGFISFSTTSNIERMRIDDGGNVGIGTTMPGEYKLAVNGKVRAHEIKVENANWPDYVFAKHYQLPTLQETEKHIKEKGHLPGIPSAADVKANGVDLGEMNAKLLQKIEELTLYLIQKDKEIKSVENLKEKIVQLEMKIDKLIK